MTRIDLNRLLARSLDMVSDYELLKWLSDGSRTVSSIADKFVEVCGFSDNEAHQVTRHRLRFLYKNGLATDASVLRAATICVDDTINSLDNLAEIAENLLAKLEASNEDLKNSETLLRAIEASRKLLDSAVSAKSAMFSIERMQFAISVLLSAMKVLDPESRDKLLTEIRKSQIAMGVFEQQAMNQSNEGENGSNY